jgi:hypothetical protein
MSDKPKGTMSDKWTAKVPPVAPPAKAPAPSVPPSVDSVSTVNPARRQQQIMVDFRYKNGNSQAFGYAYLVTIKLDPTESLILEFTAHRVTLEGKNLRKLYRRFLIHQVASVHVVDRMAVDDGPSACRVYSIEIRPI